MHCARSGAKRWWRAAVYATSAVVLAACAQSSPENVRNPDEWPNYGGDAGGSRYSSIDQIDAGNVGELAVAWTFSTGDVSHDPGREAQGPCGSCHTGEVKFEATPILVDGRLLVPTPLNRIIALDPATGQELWRFDPKVRLDIDRNEGFVSRGVAYWKGPGEAGAVCARRVFLGTIEARLPRTQSTAATGKPCPGSPATARHPRSWLRCAHRQDAVGLGSDPAQRVRPDVRELVSRGRRSHRRRQRLGADVGGCGA